jgi:hypothetical protein
LESKDESIEPLEAMHWQTSEKYFSIITKDIGFDGSESERRAVRGVLEMLEFIEASLERVSILNFNDAVEPLGDKDDL